MKIWAAKEIKGRISALNAVKIRAVIKTSFDPKKIAEDYLASNPDKSGNLTADNVRARSWAMLHIQTNPQPLEKAIKRVLAEGWVTGKKAAHSMIKSEITKASVTQIVLDPKADIWAGWKPGDEATALLLDPPNGLQTLLDGARFTASDSLKSSADQIGTQLAEGFRAGDSVKQMADRIANVTEDPSKALTIAMTEMSRATNISAMNSYTEAGLGSVQWYGIDPCDLCAENDGEIVALGDSFPSGDSEPPVHPNCLCTVLPVIDETAYKDVTAQIDEAAQNGFDSAQARESVLSAAMIDTASQVAGRMSGFGFRLKQMDSISRKIGDALKTSEARSAKQAVNEMSDLNRYTIVLPSSDYVNGARGAIDDLIKKGYQLRVKNYWEREDYRGINIAIKDKSGKEFELQLHTEESVKVKEELHKLYEEYRVEKNQTKRWTLWQKMTKLAKNIPDPKNYQELLKIGEIKTTHFTDFMGNQRGGTSSYSKWMAIRGVK